MGTICRNEHDERATQTDFLERRLELNRESSSANFDQWLFQRLKVKAGEDVLDVGCGSGAQTIPFSELVGGGGSVSALDISSDSVALLKRRLKADVRVEATAADMASLGKLISDFFSVKRYDLAHSSYALYYSPKRIEVLDAMRGALKSGGRCAVFTPNVPHGLVNLAGRFTKIPEAVTDSLVFGSSVLEPYFKKNFSSFEVHYFHNIVTLSDADALIEFYRQTTYHDAAAEQDMKSVANEEIARTGSYKYEKNGYLIIGYGNVG